MKSILIFGFLTFHLSVFGQSQTYLISELSYPIKFHFEEDFRSFMGGTVLSKSIYENTRINIRPAIGFGYQKLPNKIGVDFNAQLRFLSGKADFYDYFDGTAYDGELTLRMTEFSTNLNIILNLNEIIKIKFGSLLNLYSSDVSFSGVKQIQYERGGQNYFIQNVYNPPLETVYTAKWDFPNAGYGFSVSCVKDITPNSNFYAKYVFNRSFMADDWNHELNIQYIAIGLNYFFKPNI